MARLHLVRRLVAGLPALVLLLAFGTFVLAAHRGIDVTDEAYYLLHYAHWRDFSFHVTLFGAYWEGPYRILGESIGAMRVLGAATLLLAGAFFWLRLAEFGRAQLGLTSAPGRPAVLAAMAFAMFFFAPFGTLRLPSYNTLALLTALLASGALLGLLQHMGSGAEEGRRGLRAHAGLYGLAMCVCLFSKATTAAGLFVLHLMLLASFKSCWSWRALPAAVGWGLLGALANLAFVQLSMPGWWDAAVRGVALSRLMEERNQLLALKGLSWDLQRFAGSHAGLLIGMMAMTGGALLLARHRPRHAQTLSLMISLGLSTVVAWQLCGAADAKGWLLVLPFAAALLWLSARGLERDKGRVRDRHLLLLLAFLTAAPVAFSLGTNMALAWHSQLAAVFPLCACVLMLWRLQAGGALSPTGAHLALAVLSLPVFIAQLQPWFMPSRVYRAHGVLTEQVHPLAPPSRLAGVSTDRVLRADLVAFQQTLVGAGFARGDAVLDFTGDSHGLVYAAGGRTLGTAWLLGGYPGSGQATGYMLAQLPAAAVQQAWLLSSALNPRRIAGWQRLLDQRLGLRCHERVAEFVFHSPYTWGPSRVAAAYPVEIWRPLKSCRPLPAEPVRP